MKNPYDTILMVSVRVCLGTRQSGYIDRICDGYGIVHCQCHEHLSDLPIVISDLPHRILALSVLLIIIPEGFSIHHHAVKW